MTSFRGVANGEVLYVKHNAKWLHVSQFKASALVILKIVFNVNKTCQLKPGKGAGIW
jgi:hypothetical protein